MGVTQIVEPDPGSPEAETRRSNCCENESGFW